MNATTMTSKTSGRAERRLEDRMQTTTECYPRPFRSFSLASFTRHQSAERTFSRWVKG